MSATHRIVPMEPVGCHPGERRETEANTRGERVECEPNDEFGALCERNAVRAGDCMLQSQTRLLLLLLLSLSTSPVRGTLDAVRR